jgi:hypothetical protein
MVPRTQPTVWWGSYLSHGQKILPTHLLPGATELLVVVTLKPASLTRNLVFTKFTYTCWDASLGMGHAHGRNREREGNLKLGCG